MPCSHPRVELPMPSHMYCLLLAEVYAASNGITLMYLPTLGIIEDGDWVIWSRSGVRARLPQPLAGNICFVPTRHWTELRST
jgi:hypothetical protein